MPSWTLAPRVAEIAPFHVMELLRRAHALERAGHDVIHMEVGEPDFPTPEPIVAAAERFLRSGRVPYTNAAGLPELRVPRVCGDEPKFQCLRRTVEQRSPRMRG